MNIRKIIPFLLPASFIALSFYACNSSKSTTSGTPGSLPDTTKSRSLKPTSYLKSESTRTLSSGTPGSRPDTTRKQ
jgi:hypothetical protein